VLDEVLGNGSQGGLSATSSPRLQQAGPSAIQGQVPPGSATAHKTCRFPPRAIAQVRGCDKPSKQLAARCQYSCLFSSPGAGASNCGAGGQQAPGDGSSAYRLKRRNCVFWTFRGADFRGTARIFRPEPFESAFIALKNLPKFA